MEEGAVTDGVALVCESEAALSDRLIEALDGGEAAVGEGSSTKRQRCSAGWSSGLWAGWNTRRMPSGTARFKPTSARCRSARQLNPGRSSIYRCGEIVQTTGTTSAGLEKTSRHGMVFSIGSLTDPIRPRGKCATCCGFTHRRKAKHASLLESMNRTQSGRLPRLRAGSWY